MSLFKRANLSREEFEEGQGNDVEVIDAIDSNDEVNEIASDMQADVAAVEEAEDVIEELSEQVEENEAALETPEEVDAVDVAVSQEALHYATKRLGTSMSDMGLGVISRESAKDDAVTALRLSTEGVKEFINTVIEQIKRLMRNVGMAFKKLYVKALTVFNNTEKAAKKLRDSLKNHKDETPTYDEETKEWFAEKFPGIIVSNGLGFNESGIRKFIAEINDVSKKERDVKTINAEISALEANIAKSNDAKEKDKLGEKLKAKLDTRDGTFLTLHDGGKKYTEYRLEDVDSEKKFSLKKESSEFDSADANQVKPLSKTNITNILNDIVAKGNKKVYDAGKKLLDESDKEASKFYKALANSASWSTAERSEYIRYTSKMLTIGTSIVLDMILVNLRGQKNALAICSKAASKLGIEIKK